MYRAKVYVYPKEGILDPPGKAVHQILKNMGYKAVNGVRVGKFVTLELNSALTEAEAYQQMEEMCQKLLANPIIEDYRFEIEKVTEEQE